MLSTLGKSVVDYVNQVQPNCFGKYNHFRVTTMLDTLNELNIPTDSSVPDHSLLPWEYRTDHILEDRHHHSLQDNRTNQHNKMPRSFWGQQGKPIFKSKGTDDKAIDQLIKELDDLTLSDTMHALGTQLQRNYNSIYSLTGFSPEMFQGIVLVQIQSGRPSVGGSRSVINMPLYEV